MEIPIFRCLCSLITFTQLWSDVGYHVDIYISCFGPQQRIQYVHDDKVEEGNWR